MDDLADPTIEDVEVDYEADDDDDDENVGISVHAKNDNIGVNISNTGVKIDACNHSLIEKKETPSKRKIDDGAQEHIRLHDKENNYLVEETPPKRARVDASAAARIVSNTVERAQRQPPSTSKTGKKMVTSGSSSYGIYVPPFRRKELEKQQKEELQISSSDKDANNVPAVETPSIQNQRQNWESLKKSINGTINRLNTNTIKDLIHALFQNANLIRGKGVLAKSLLRAATTSPTYAAVYASLLSVINTKLPEIGELVLVRAILTFRKSYARQDRSMTMSITNFIGCLFNQGLCHELLCLQLLTVLLEGDPTDDSVDVAVQFTKVVGMTLLESSPTGVHAIMERFRNLLHDGRIGRRVQFKIEELMKVKRSRFKEFPALVEELDLVERDEQITFELGLDDEELEKEESLDVFRYDQDWGSNEQDWIEIRREILGEDSDDDMSSDGDDDSETNDEESDGDDSDDNEDGVLPEAAPLVPKSSLNNKQITEIHDMSEKDLINLRRTIYLTIMSSATFEECSHKLSKMDIPSGKEMELINMVIECCSQERTFLMYYGMVAARFCLMHRRWSDAFLQAFVDQYNTIHRLETNKLRNVAKMFAHLLHTDSLSWSCLAAVHLNEDETTSSSRIFLKIIVQEMAAAMGIEKLVKRFETDDPETFEWFQELFPKDNPRKTRYAINFFTSIGLGPLTDGLREHLKNAPKMIMMQAEAEAKKLRAKGDDGSDESSVLSSSSSDSSSLSSSSMSSSSRGSYSSYSSYSSSDSFTSSSDESSVRGRRKRRSKGKSRRKGQRRNYSSDSSVTTYDRSSIYSSQSRKHSKSRKRESFRSSSRSRSRNKSKKSRDSFEKVKSSAKRREAFSPIGSEIKIQENSRKSPSYSRSPRSRSRSTEDRSKRDENATKRNDENGRPSKSKREEKRRSRSKSVSTSVNSDGSASDRDGKREGSLKKRSSRKRSYSRSSSSIISRDRESRRNSRKHKRASSRRLSSP